MGTKTKYVIARPLLLFQKERQTVSYFLGCPLIPSRAGGDLNPVFFQNNMEHKKMFVFFMLKG
jgi:hypothetical protein